MDTFGRGVAYRDESDGRVQIGLMIPRGTDVAFFTEEAIPAFFDLWGISGMSVEIHVDPTIPAVLTN